MSKQSFNVRVADKDTGDETTFSIKADSLEQAEAKCVDADWLVISNTDNSPSSIVEYPQSSTGTIWTPTDPTERAIVRGIIKAYLIILVSTALLVFAAWVVISIANGA